MTIQSLLLPNNSAAARQESYLSFEEVRVKKIGHITGEMDDYIYAMKIARGREPSQIHLNPKQFDLLQSASGELGNQISKNDGHVWYRGIPVKKTGNATT